MALTKREKELLKELVQSQIETLEEFISERQGWAMDFSSTKEFIKELETILAKLSS